MIEFYEFGVYALVTEEITSNFFDASDTSGVWFGFAISFVARPFGGFFFGWMADAISRRAALMVSCAEHAGPKMAAFGVAVACATAAFGTIVAELLLLLTAVLDDQQMLNWGWRVPFLVVLPWGVA